MHSTLDIHQLVTSRQEGYGLPRAFYQDEALYAYELEQIWRRGWVFAGHTCQIKHPGDYLVLTLATDSVLILRDDDGAVRAFHNICTHRGTLLCVEEAGHIRAIVCPYHQWTFSRKGILMICSGMPATLDKSALALRPVPIETCEGLIFVSLAHTPPPFQPLRELLAPFARPQGLERARMAKVIDYIVRANWKLVWENNRECYHCALNHPRIYQIEL